MENLQYDLILLILSYVSTTAVFRLAGVSKQFAKIVSDRLWQKARGLCLEAQVNRSWVRASSRKPNKKGKVKWTFGSFCPVVLKGGDKNKEKLLIFGETENWDKGMLLVELKTGTHCYYPYQIDYARHMGSAIVHKNRVYLFGGHNYTIARAELCVWKGMDRSSSHDFERQNKGVHPSARGSHGAAYDGEKYMYIGFGADCDDNDEGMDDFWRMDCDSFMWEQLGPPRNYQNDKSIKYPGPRHDDVCMTYYDGKVFVAGGSCTGWKTDGVWIYDVAKKQWDEVALPEHCMFMKNQTVKLNRFWIVGLIGVFENDSSELEYTHVFDLKTLTWGKLDISSHNDKCGTPISKRYDGDDNYDILIPVDDETAIMRIRGYGNDTVVGDKICFPDFYLNTDWDEILG
eukprot:GHVU01195698.1.p1 GENE.GHVU01195698.1~~GHVU01195698.1.p1  ORF type:complete len:401 (+),score=30.37 GHVU01195698.1:143-1345(+)